ncbi:MAG: hypothetical protein M0D57_01190 [Sphingobacteriales bacterium JAD_PAG50586_3]|nr:MAG: hypothetical protein M0D57_01190 [Sphingobacteriales bacterium JAD_PAG50586_3]
MNRLIPIILLLSFYLSGFAQNPELNIHNKKLADFIMIEKKAGGEIFASKSNHISGKGIAQPLIFKHKEKNLPYLFTYYFFYKSDSTISYILYEWDNTNIVGYDDVTIMPEKELKALINKYSTLTNYITNIYGPSKSTGSLDGLSEIATKGIQKNDTWQPNDSTEIEMYTYLSSKNEKKGMISVSPTYRIRLYVRNTKPSTNKSALPKPDDHTIEALDSTARLFFKDLADKNYEGAKTHISDLIIKSVTTKKLEDLANNIRYNDGISIYMTGVQQTANGEDYLMIKYKYDNDAESPPKDLINVLFDNRKKIATIKPTQRF